MFASCCNALILCYDMTYTAPPPCIAPCRTKLHLYSFWKCFSLFRRSHATNLLNPPSTSSGASSKFCCAQSAFQVSLAFSNNLQIFYLRYLRFSCVLLLGVHMFPNGMFSHWSMLFPLYISHAFSPPSPYCPHLQAYTKSHKMSLLRVDASVRAGHF
jgi:hypothetical protein